MVTEKGAKGEARNVDISLKISGKLRTRLVLRYNECYKKIFVLVFIDSPAVEGAVACFDS